MNIQNPQAPHQYPPALCPQCNRSNTDGWPLLSSRTGKYSDTAGCDDCWSRDPDSQSYYRALQTGLVEDLTFGLIQLDDNLFRAFFPFSGDPVSGWGRSPAAAMLDLMRNVEKDTDNKLFTKGEAING